MIQDFLRSKSLTHMENGRWTTVLGANREIIVASCPLCGFQHTIGCIVYEDGTMDENFECLSETCDFSGRARLKGWTTTSF